MIDIVIPAYTGGRHLETAVRSVRAQTAGDWRLHVLDDASPGSAIRDLVAAQDDSRISYRRNEQNRGINAQFNRALGIGEAPHLVIMGEDDEMLPEYVARISQLWTAFPEASVIQPGVVVIDDQGQPVRPLGDRVKSRLAMRPESATAYQGEALMVSLLRGDWCYFPSLCWRRSALAGLSFPQHFDVVLDLALLIEVIRRGGSLVVDPTPAFRYRRHSQSLSSEQAVDGRRFAEEATYFREVADTLSASGHHRAARAARRHVTSRLHALSRLPAAARTRDREAVRLLLRHVAH